MKRLKITTVQVSVIDADQPLVSGVGVPIPGAQVNLVSLDVPGLNFTINADSNGLAVFSTVPAGNYAWNVQATGFYPISGTAIIESGITNSIQAVLPTATVSYAWSVVPTNIQDQYDIALALTFMTDVPAPAIVVSPALTSLTMADGETAYSQFTVTNKGLVAAMNVVITPNSGTHLKIALPFTTIPVLNAGQTVVVPVKLTFDPQAPLCDGAGTGIQYQVVCAAGVLTVIKIPGANYVAGAGAGCNGVGAHGSSGGSAGSGGPGGGGATYIGLALRTGAAATPSCSNPGGPAAHRSNPICPLGHGADPTNGLTHPHSNAPIGFPAPTPAPIYQPVENSLNPQPGSTGYGWAPPTQTVVSNPDGSFTRTNTDNSQETIVPIGSLTQPQNGNGAQFAYPVQMFDTLLYSNNALAQTDPSGTVTQYQVYGSTYLPASVTDRNGNTVAYARDSSGNLLQETDAYGRALNFNYTAGVQITSITDSAGRSTSYTYDGSGNMSSETDVNGDETQYVYDGSHRITQITYPNGGVRTFSYDGQGRVSVESDNDGNDENTYVYSLSSTTVTDALGHVTEYDWTEVQGLREVTRIVDANSGITTMGYDSNMNMISETDPLGHTTNYQYDSKGNVTAAVDANGGTTLTTYDPTFNQPTSAIDAKGNKTNMSYDAFGDQLQVQDPLGGTTQSSYNTQGQVTTSQDPLFFASSYTYSSNNGALASATDPLNRTTQFQTDLLSRVITSTDPAGEATQFQYDADGNMTQTTDAMGNVTNYSYESGRRSVLLSTVTDANGNATGFGYDVLGRQVSMTNALSQMTTSTYDLKGNLIQTVNARGQTINYTYDDLDRLIQKSMPEGQINYAYDAAGNMLSANSYNGSSSTNTYDALNRLTQTIQTLPDGYSATIGYAYDVNSNRTSMTTPWGNFSYTYDALNRLAQIVNPQGKAFIFTYDANSRRTSLTYPNGIVTNYKYDTAGQVLSIIATRTSDGLVVSSEAYTYDEAGNRTSMTDIEGTHSYGYDDLYRLTIATHPAGTVLPIQNETFSYDDVGNRLADAQISSYIYDDANRLISNSSFTYTYDADGNMTAKTQTGVSTMSYSFNSINQLTGVTLPGATMWIYKYDANGRRVENSSGTSAGQTVRYVYDDQNILAILDSSSSPIIVFADSLKIDEPLLIHRSDTDYSVHVDATGSVRVHSSTAGAVVEYLMYQVYGSPVFIDMRSSSPTIENSSLTGSPVCFSGRDCDSELQFINMRGRQTYDPLIGRFEQKDPAGIPGGVNLYLYADNNPANETDPLGLMTFSCTRPLKNSLGIRFGPLYHQYICIGNPKGEITCAGLGPSGEPWGSPGTLEPDVYSPKQCTPIADTNQCLEDCIQKIFDGPLPYYSIYTKTGAQQCQTFAQNTVYNCMQTCHVEGIGF